MMRWTLGDKVNGHLYSKDDLTPEEIAEGRHRNSILDSEIRDPASTFEEIPPEIVARHIGLGWLSALCLFISGNRGWIGGAIAVVSVLNWEKIATWATLIAEVMK